MRHDGGQNECRVILRSSWAVYYLCCPLSMYLYCFDAALHWVIFSILFFLLHGIVWYWIVLKFHFYFILSFPTLSFSIVFYYFLIYSFLLFTSNIYILIDLLWDSLISVISDSISLFYHVALSLSSFAFPICHPQYLFFSFSLNTLIPFYCHLPFLISFLPSLSLLPPFHLSFSPSFVPSYFFWSLPASLL